ncbi:hypothetical protein COCC4DRAFT_55893 [Bipolaris maydis ATCC 48331]|uniref:Uncharacterized protein n=2 Tax=Cochliobolus heterostrophus TaxID=5016 RepID=N4XLZ6_COCH4|nr:uncharacterized protein COCC4DRAFT_55893 [Bipolaris maydis ATCC 48331]KAJ5025206.1 hypothetical protein J3E73DRAFT_48529 [Bipolaris maydis]ENI09658.1 hypothetical protein COCC4DRAFT_55893 [Bipolaris maydis ATCC 48331]KAJ5063795.1 hypothetical protein J3E74DRAFT_22871 [Bipolaris maydis]KAJ6197054.1 hypothetical protein J3E72DRAFT_48127 [Bipolaris maydis]KAJ6269424.1 hypothetical protein PSV08DRAFT_46592 [Bipolaris maydis]
MAEETSPFTTRHALYGSVHVAASSRDSAIQVSPASIMQHPFAPGRRYYIYPPFIKGHGRLIPARRTVPYLVGLFLVIAVFAWAVCSALSVSPLLGHPHHPRPPAPATGLGQ